MYLNERIKIPLHLLANVWLSVNILYCLTLRDTYTSSWLLNSMPLGISIWIWHYTSKHGRNIKNHSQSGYDQRKGSNKSVRSVMLFFYSKNIFFVKLLNTIAFGYRSVQLNINCFYSRVDCVILGLRYLLLEIKSMWFLKSHYACKWISYFQ